MREYVKSTVVLAEQFSPTKKEKDSLIKDPKREKAYSPAVIMGSEIRISSDGKYHITKNVGNEKLSISEDDWLVKEGVDYYVVSNFVFEKQYKAQAEVKVSKK